MHTLPQLHTLEWHTVFDLSLLHSGRKLGGALFKNTHFICSLHQTCRVTFCVLMDVCPSLLITAFLCFSPLFVPAALWEAEGRGGCLCVSCFTFLHCRTHTHAQSQSLTKWTWMQTGNFKVQHWKVCDADSVNFLHVHLVWTLCACPFWACVCLCVSGGCTLLPSYITIVAVTGS